MDYIWQGLQQAAVLIFTLDPETYSAVITTLKVTFTSITLSVIIGVPLGFLLGYFNFPGKKQLRMVVDTLLAIPTVVVGLLVYAFISRRGPLGWTNLLYTVPGIAIAQVFLILPIVISLTATAIEGLDRRLRPTLRSLGAGRVQLALTSLHEARFAVLIAVITAYGRAISEVGIAMMIGGNIKWYTRTMTTAITLETGKGQFSMGIALGVILLLIVFLLNSALVLLRRRTT
ncbi:MAG: ABC transporter permease [Desulfomonilia bacterium]|jgi:tungstate transport system permease protein|uniref:Tungstate uptake system permease protein TupB n=1 Tax=anaerobic digester metagenome TaxID=1263854 RepID=A0A485LU93_9ZZZZ|nr:ABC transporter permease [Pseudomonadota bacterium]HON37857.1 ABC transporter permease [Deltaproteobacteria bacterium]HRS55905.1 ABC transporter permease [Desulfomonilia bacterium]HPD21116.1 ABC transporter permease [Deltaproteobacteria bacterium]HPX18022.1 ABC transporter permease [Deltaproteobacteria bacterium]